MDQNQILHIFVVRQNSLSKKLTEIKLKNVEAWPQNVQYFAYLRIFWENR